MSRAARTCFCIFVLANSLPTLILLKSPSVTCSLFLNARSSSSSPSLRLPLEAIPLLLRVLLVELLFAEAVAVVVQPLLLLPPLLPLLLLLPPMPLASASRAAFAAASGLGVPRRVDSGAECRLATPFNPVSAPPPSAAAAACDDGCCALLLLLVEGIEARFEALRAGEAPELALPHRAAPMAPNQLPLALGLALSALAPL